MKHVVIDMGSSRISVMAAEVSDDGKVRILSEESKKSDGIKYGFVEQPSTAAFSINELARLLQNSARLNEIKKICVSLNAKTMKQIPVRIARSLGFGRVVTQTLVDEMGNECYNKLEQPEVEVYDVIPLFYELDGRKTDDPVGEKGSELIASYNLIVGNADIKTELERCFVRTTVKAADFMPLSMEALSEVLLDDEEREAGCALINLGATTTTLALYAEGVLQQLLVVPLGGKNITTDIQDLGISEVNAERLKSCLKSSALKRLVTHPIRIQIASANVDTPPVKIDTDFLATIIESRLAEIMDPIFKALQKSPFELEAGIVLSGGGSKLNDIVDFVEERTGLNVRFGDHSSYLSPDTDKRFFDPVYAQSVGTALLLHDYAEEHPVEIRTESEPVKPTKRNANSANSFADKIKNRFSRLFEDDDYLK